MNRGELLSYFRGDELAADAWLDKYRIDNEQTPNDTITRIAKEFHRIESHYKNPLDYDTIYKYLKDFKYIIPAGSPLIGIGNNSMLTSLSNCYVVDSPVDSYAGILKTDEELVQLMKRRGGVGVDLSTLRPSGTAVNNAARTSSGGTSFMSRYSHTTMEVAQEGRRGALILTIDIKYPDIIKFITSKDDLSKINGANISVRITDDFMSAVLNDDDFQLSYNDTVYATVKARKIWDVLIQQAWKTAEPGVLFWDKIIKESPADCYKGFNTISTNPCGELPLCSYDSCRLMHVNTFSFVEEPFTHEAHFNLHKYLRTIYDAQRLMDDMIDLELEKLEEIIKKVHNRDPEDKKLKEREHDLWLNIRGKLISGRRTGLNPLLGLADTLAGLGMKYDSDEAILFSYELAQNAALAIFESDVVLASERGAFPLWNLDREKDNSYLNRIVYTLHQLGDSDLISDYKKYGRRNISCSTVPPSGSVAILSRVSSGIEPVFNLSYNRRRRVTEDTPNKSYKDENGDWWMEYEVLHPRYEEYLVTKEYCDAHGIGCFENPYIGATANEINPLQKIKMQGAVQQWIDHSISITHNLPEKVTKEEVSELYMQAWKYGCKGMTIYRENSRHGILSNKPTFIQNNAPKRPKALPHDVYSIMSKGHHWVVCVGILEDKPYEVFVFNNIELPGTRFAGEIIKQAKGRYDLSIRDIGYYEDITKDCSDEENLLTRMISTSLRHGANIKFIVEQLNKSTGDVTSFGKGIARILRKYIQEEIKTSICTECGNQLTIEGGCEVCKNCGYSKCS